MKIVYYSDDNKAFDTQKECIEYEANKKKEAEARKRKEALREKRYAEVEDAYQNYKKLAKKFWEDYPEHDYKSDTLLSLINALL